MLPTGNPISDRCMYLVCGTEKDLYQFLRWVHFPNASVKDLPHPPRLLVWENPHSIESYPRRGVHVSYAVKPCTVCNCSMTLALRVNKTCQRLLIDLSFSFCQCKNPRVPQLLEVGPWCAGKPEPAKAAPAHWRLPGAVAGCYVGRKASGSQILNQSHTLDQRENLKNK